MKSLFKLGIIAIAAVAIISAFSEENSTATASGTSGSSGSGYSYNSGKNYSYDYCNYCNGLREVSCDNCYGLGYITLNTPNYNGVYDPDDKVDCSRCFEGDMDCPHC